MLNRSNIINRKSMLYSASILIFFISIGIYISFRNFLFFQVIANIFTMIIGVSMAIISFNTYEISQVQYFTYLGLSYGFVAFFDGLHILTHPKITLFNYPLEISIRLWIIARIIQSISLCLSFLNLKYKFRINLFFIIYSFVTVFSVYIIFNTDIFNPNTFSIILFTIILISLSIIIMFNYKKYFNKDIYYLLVFSMLFLLVSNIFFLNFLGEKNIQHALGYIFKILSFYLLYKSLNSINLKEPYKTLFYKLNKNNQILEEKTAELKLVNKKLTILSLKDSLTGLYNRAYFEEEIRLMGKLGYETLAIIVADLDDMKVVNDNMGHLMGDKYLKDAANILKTSLRDNDTVARIGGDEFAIILYDIEKKDVENLICRIKESIENYNRTNNEFIMSISIGWDLIKNGEKSIEKTFKTADEKMYKEKLKNKNSRFKCSKAKS